MTLTKDDDDDDQDDSGDREKVEWTVMRAQSERYGEDCSKSGYLLNLSFLCCEEASVTPAGTLTCMSRVPAITVFSLI